MKVELQVHYTTKNEPFLAWLIADRWKMDDLPGLDAYLNAGDFRAASPDLAALMLARDIGNSMVASERLTDFGAKVRYCEAFNAVSETVTWLDTGLWVAYFEGDRCAVVPFTAFALDADIGLLSQTWELAPPDDLPDEDGEPAICPECEAKLDAAESN